MLQRLSDALTELGIVCAKLRFIESVLQKLQRDEARRRRNEPEPKKEA